MRVRVLYFGMLKEMVGRSGDNFDLPENSTLADLLDRAGQAAPPIANHRDVLAYAVNLEFAQESQPLHEGDEVGILPPVSGGASEEDPLVKIVREKIVPHEIVPRLERPEDGAIVIFDGIVRNHSRGRRTLYLDYHAYEEMALKQMRSLAEDARKRFAVRQVAIIHRLGKLEIGESSVLIVVCSAHRAAAFDACRFLIDSLKKTVPIWKKEYFEDGAVWADGEPFPDEIRPRTTQVS
jgi:MoaE-MoaD fusion protein